MIPRDAGLTIHVHNLDVEIVMTSTTDTDQLLALAQDGDASACDQLLVKHRSRLRKMISACLDPRLSARIDASDVLQDALALASVKLPDYLCRQPISFYPWLRQIVQEQIIISHRRHVKALRRSINREDPNQFSFSEASAIEIADRLFSNESTPSIKADREENRRLIQSALDQLPTSDRELLVMRYVEQLKISEIAEILEIAEAAAKSRVRRALENLGGQLGGELDS